MQIVATRFLRDLGDDFVVHMQDDRQVGAFALNDRTREEITTNCLDHILAIMYDYWTMIGDDGKASPRSAVHQVIDLLGSCRRPQSSRVAALG